MIPENIQAYLVLSVIVVAFLLIYKQTLRPPIAFLLANMIFVLTGILTAQELLGGLANESIISILLLILLTAGIRKNFDLEWLFDRIYQRSSGYRSFLFTMMAKVAVISSLLNNTPVVAAMTPYVFNWGRKNNIPPSKLLIPLSFATICGGMITIIGTSTTLVLNGFLLEKGAGSLNLWNIFIIGITVTAVVLLFITFLGHRLLPSRSGPWEDFNKNSREYLVETKLTPGSPLIDNTVIEGGLRHLQGVYLVEIIRNDVIISPVDPLEKIEKDDILIFAGNTENILDLVKPERGLALPANATSLIHENLQLVEVVVGNNSSLLGKKVAESDFRNRYNAAIVAMHRNGEKLRGKIGSIRIRQGDLLLLFAGRKFSHNLDLYRDLYLVSKLREVNRPGPRKVLSLGLVGMVALTLLIAGHFSLFISLLIVFAMMASLRMISTQDIKREVDLNLLAILIFSLAMGNAVIKTGAGDLMADAIMQAFAPFGNAGILGALLIVTTVLTSFISNVGAISVTFPVAYSLSASLGLEGGPFYLAIAFAASAAFLTPIGYQTNLIVYGPGGYSFKDFFRIGLPVTMIYLVTVYLLLLWLYPQL